MQVYQSSDPLDSKDFDPIDYINQLFPTEQVSSNSSLYFILLANCNIHVPRWCLYIHDVIHVYFSLTQSLAGVDDTVHRMKIKLNQLDEEIRTVVRDQAESGHDGRQVWHSVCVCVCVCIQHWYTHVSIDYSSYQFNEQVHTCIFISFISFKHAHASHLYWHITLCWYCVRRH